MFALEVLCDALIQAEDDVTQAVELPLNKEKTHTSEANQPKLTEAMECTYDCRVVVKWLCMVVDLMA